MHKEHVRECSMSQEILTEVLSELDESGQDAPGLDCKEQFVDGRIQCPSSEQSPSDGDIDLDNLAVENDSDPLMSDALSQKSDTCLQPSNTDGGTGTQSQLVGPTHDTAAEMHLPAASEQEIRTWVGRVRKRVNRLIESMVQKPFGFRDLTGSVTKRSQLLLTLF